LPDPSAVKDYGKEIIRKMVQKRVRHQVEEEWHNIMEDDWCTGKTGKLKME
jgi:hypothetical protein